LCAPRALLVKGPLTGLTAPDGHRAFRSLLAVLNDAERLLVAQTGRAELAALDEDAAIELEARASTRALGARRQAGRDS
jgi:hypothetical protein